MAVFPSDNSSRPLPRRPTYTVSHIPDTPSYQQSYGRQHISGVFHQQRPCSTFISGAAPANTMEDPRHLPITLTPSLYPSTSDLYSAWSFDNNAIRAELPQDDGSNTVSTLDSMDYFPDMYQQDHYSQFASGTIEPRMMLYQHDNFAVTDNFSYPYVNNVYAEYLTESPLFDPRPLPVQTTASQEQGYSYENNDNSPTFSDVPLNNPLDHHFDADENPADMPYAKLIYQALWHAPEHRMMLRELYDWFRKHTNKPQESGTNGWQNSIRHNLSMNQAFENDKSASSPAKGSSRKANSVWTLTDDAIKNGVQSTTRYRKTGNFKRAGLHRSPAVQRQRSGAKGNQAAKKGVARTKREDEIPWTTNLASPAYASSSLPQADMFLDGLTTDQAPHSLPYQPYQPTTPAEDGYPGALYALPTFSYAYNNETPLKTEHDNIGQEEAPLREYLLYSDASPTFDKVSQD